MSETALSYALAKLEPKPGDVIVVKTDKVLTRDQAAHIRATITHALPLVRALVADGGVEITLMTADELRQRLGEIEKPSPPFDHGAFPRKTV